MEVDACDDDAGRVVIREVDGESDRRVERLRALQVGHGQVTNIAVIVVSLSGSDTLAAIQTIERPQTHRLVSPGAEMFEAA